MTATEILRRMLDERGVEWTNGGMFHRTHWVIDGVHHIAFEQDGKLYLQSSIGPLAPEQAIAAPLGTGTCEADETDRIECVETVGGRHYDIHIMECTECGHTYEHVNGDYEYCPRCGRKREDVSE